MFYRARMTPLERAIEYAGSQSALARALGVGRSRVHNWLHRDKKVPAEFAVPIERATRGKVKRIEIRPDVFA